MSPSIMAIRANGLTFDDEPLDFLGGVASFAGRELGDEDMVADGGG